MICFIFNLKFTCHNVFHLKLLTMSYLKDPFHFLLLHVLSVSVVFFEKPCSAFHLYNSL